MTIQVCDIVWDTDGHNADLPIEGWVISAFPNGYILNGEDKSSVIDELSDKYGCKIKTANVICWDSD